MTFSTPDLQQLSEQWPLHKFLRVADKGFILVAGAYKGRYCSFLAEKFPNAKIIGYEPQIPAWWEAVEATRKYPNVTIQNLAIANGTGSAKMKGCGTDGCSFYSSKDEAAIKVPTVDINELLMFFPVLDLAVLNMEGSEYALLPIIWPNRLPESIAVQCHPSLNPSQNDYAIERLREDFDCIYDDYPTWSYWVKK